MCWILAHSVWSVKPTHANFDEQLAFRCFLRFLRWSGNVSIRAYYLLHGHVRPLKLTYAEQNNTWNTSSHKGSYVWPTRCIWSWNACAKCASEESLDKLRWLFAKNNPQHWSYGTSFACPALWHIRLFCFALLSLSRKSSHTQSKNISTGNLHPQHQHSLRRYFRPILRHRKMGWCYQRKRLPSENGRNLVVMHHPHFLVECTFSRCTPHHADPKALLSLISTFLMTIQQPNEKGSEKPVQLWSI